METIMNGNNLPIHSAPLASMTKPVGQEQLESVGLVALSKQKEQLFLVLHGLFAVSIEIVHHSRLV